VGGGEGKKNFVIGNEGRQQKGRLALALGDNLGRAKQKRRTKKKEKEHTLNK
jgi:hypothetical protein